MVLYKHFEDLYQEKVMLESLELIMAQILLGPVQNWARHFQRWTTRKCVHAGAWMSMDPAEKESSYCLQYGRSVGVLNKICTFNLGSSTKNTWNKSEWWIIPNISCWSRSYCQYKAHHIKIFIRCSYPSSTVSNAITGNGIIFRSVNLYKYLHFWVFSGKKVCYKLLISFWYSGQLQSLRALVFLVWLLSNNIASILF